MQKAHLRLLLWISAFSAIAGGFYVSCEHPISTIFGIAAVHRLEISESDLLEPEAAYEVRRKIQQAFLEYDVYLPMENIIAEQPDESRLNFLMRKACGQAKLYIWYPIRINLPFIGRRTLEWCWKPSIQPQARLN